ncbi:hypothetical protein [Myceligenerans xiligouense]|uniref:Carboxypeptidase regulatory-like domain-containing protein n=1 Tax=Myceligenerans xiligouense TaxID=253184 RepID=A0A3N4YW69_9MICO|nr:hypothetical protein [Myceligenerans xiligouense]RPF22890.1 hypothetical protein EDD34_3565 [Myceligenerans xiligouense]
MGLNGQDLPEIRDDELTLSPAEPMDDADRAVLAHLAEVASLLDPMPDDLVERSLFAATLAGLEAEVMEVVQLSDTAAGVRSATAPAEGAPTEARTISFTHGDLTLMIQLSAERAGRIRVDGWIAVSTPSYTVELHRPGTAPEVTEADEDGRFSFPAVQPGAASLIVRRPEADGGAVSTPVIEL